MSAEEARPVDHILASALDAWDAGMSVLRVRTDGTKRPVGEWKQYQTERAPRDLVQQWFDDGHHGLGVICGAVSGDLEMLELEGRFISDIGTQAFKDAAHKAGLALLLARLVNGFMVTSPSNGRHFYYRVAGEATHNQKLARRPGPVDQNGNPTLEVLIETRGEGGFVVAPPSGGAVHPSGKQWQTKAGTWAAVPTITVEERDALFDLCRQWDSAPPTVAVPVTPTRNRITIAGARRDPFASSWMDNLVDHLRTHQDMRSTLEHYGWSYEYTDAHGRHHMRRPGKDHGTSGVVNTNGRLLPFSTSVPFATGGTPPTTYDVLDVIAAYEHQGDRMAAARDLAERAGIIGNATPAPPANIDPTTGEILRRGPFPDDFWQARPYLTHIHQAAMSRMVAPAAVLGAILARVAAFTPPSTRIPPIIGTSAPLSTYVALLARSGGGKSTATGCAADLLPDIPPGCVGPLPLGSGEGMIDAYFELVEDVDGAGKKVKVKRHTRRGALFTLDEGQALAEMGNRKGATILPILRTAWSGGDAGQANASLETRRILKGGTYAVGLVSLWQYGSAARLIDDQDGGTPQRFLFIDTIDPTITVDVPAWPGQLIWNPPPSIAVGGIHQAHHMAVDDAIVDEIRTHHAAAVRGDVTVAPLDAHRRLAKLKVAGLLAVLDGRHDIDGDDWALAETIMRHSDDVRAWIISEAQRRAGDVEEARTRAVIQREAMVEDSAASRALGRAARAVHRACLRLAGEPLTKRGAHHAITSRDRQHVTVDEAIAEAERLRWIAPHGSEGWVIGDAEPRH